MNKLLKRITSSVLALLLVAGLAACNTDKPTDNPKSNAPETSTVGGETPPKFEGRTVTSSQLSADLKDKYAADDDYTFEETMESINKKEVLHIPVKINPEDLGLEDLREFTAVYIDKNLSAPLDSKTEYDEATGEILIHPPSSAALSPDSERNRWGYAGIYYMATFYNPETGEKLEKPSITQFTVENDLPASYLEFDKSQDGFASYKWTDTGADKYHIMGFSDFSSALLWSVEKDLTGTTFTHEFIDTIGTMTLTNSFYHRNDDGTGAIYNYIYIIGEKNGDFSPASNIIDVESIRHSLPYGIDTKSDTTMAAMVPKSPAELSPFVDVKMADNKTVVQYAVTYDIENREEIRIGDYVNFPEGDPSADDKAVHITFTVDGTGLAGHTYFKKFDYPEFDAELEAVLAQHAGTKGKATNSKEVLIDFLTDAKNDESAPVSESTKELVVGDFDVFASSALGEYIAINLLNGEEIIDLSDFPEARDSDRLIDAFFEALYQNPLVLSVNGLSATPDNKLIKVVYGQDQTELRQKQGEVLAEIEKIVSEIITDDMTDLEKELAINNYLCDSAEYDTAALENALENDMMPDPSFDDSFTPYGILVNKVGVCASYAGSFKLLADAADLECIVVTGYLNGNLPHAWNRINIDGEWMTIDSTNNDNPQLYNFLFNIPDNVSETMLVEDTAYMMDNKLANYKGTSEELEYYRISGGYYSTSEIADALAETLMDNDSATFRTEYNVSNAQLQDIFLALTEDPRLKDRWGVLGEAEVYSAMGMISIITE